MWGMSRRSLRKCLDEQRVMAAIQAAERMTSGEIRVSVASFFWGDVHKVAERAFLRLGMAGTRERNGVLIFLVPSRKQFVVLGDVGIHGKVGPAFWEAVAAAMGQRFRQGAFTEGLEAGIRQVGSSLAEHFPWAGADDRNELPDDLEFR
jgi:uncharacterized membrane protein